MVIESCTIIETIPYLDPAATPFEPTMSNPTQDGFYAMRARSPGQSPPPPSNTPTLHQQFPHTPYMPHYMQPSAQPQFHASTHIPTFQAAPFHAVPGVFYSHPHAQLQAHPQGPPTAMPHWFWGYSLPPPHMLPLPNDPKADYVHHDEPFALQFKELEHIHKGMDNDRGISHAGQHQQQPQPQIHYQPMAQYPVHPVNQQYSGIPGPQISMGMPYGSYADFDVNEYFGRYGPGPRKPKHWKRGSPPQYSPPRYMDDRFSGNGYVKNGYKNKNGGGGKKSREHKKKVPLSSPAEGNMNGCENSKMDKSGDVWSEVGSEEARENGKAQHGVGGGGGGAQDWSEGETVCVSDGGKLGGHEKGEDVW